ncbi:MAG: hypothetical protein QHH02_02665, partial [Syntrophomonadaceae bacterium]|nr:hypothetical protein [Syntrophomonadaceae bacterium]
EIAYIRGRQRLNRQEFGDALPLLESAFRRVPAEPRYALALARTREVLGAGIPASKIFYLLVRDYRIFSQIQQARKLKLNESELSSRLAARFKLPPYLVPRYLRSAGRLSRGALNRGLQVMLTLDVDVKTGRETPESALELLIAAISRPWPQDSPETR